jgi:hypothetical protein
VNGGGAASSGVVEAVMSGVSSVMIAA